MRMKHFGIICKFDKEEMSMVLETILRYATELGIPTGAYYD